MADAAMSEEPDRVEGPGLSAHGESPPEAPPFVLRDDLSTIFTVVWLLLGAAMSLLVLRGSLAAKRRWMPRLLLLSGAAFATFGTLIVPHWLTLAVWVPGVALITWLNLRSVRFCSQCGAFARTPGRGSADVCRRCGGKP